MKRVYVLAIIFVLVLYWIPVRAFAQSQGVIEGQVVNLTADSGSMEGLTVTLRVFMGMAEQTPRTTATDAAGRFRFEGLSTETNHAYKLHLDYQGVEYGSDLLAFSEGETTLSIPIRVYESIESAVSYTHLTLPTIYSV